MKDEIQAVGLTPEPDEQPLFCLLQDDALVTSLAVAADETSAQRNAVKPGEETVTTAIHLPKRTLALLRRVAVERANQRGGRPSVSALITDLVEEMRPTLQNEIDR